MDLTAAEIKREIHSAVKDALFNIDALPLCQLEGQKVEAIGELAKKLSIIITGNGTPENGLLVKVDRSTQAVAELKEAGKKRGDREWGIWAAILTSIIVSVLQLIAK